MRRITAFACIIAALWAGACPLAASGRFPGLSEELAARAARIELYNGRVTGENAQFYMDLPLGWKDNALAERERAPQDPGVLEQINFYCASSTGLYKQQPLLTLYVYKKDKWAENESPTPVRESKDYVFAVKYGVSGFTLKPDISLYNTTLEPVSTARKLAKYIRLPEAQEPALDRAVFVDGERLFYHMERINSVYYVRLRDVCDAMGYSVGWNARTGVITVRGPSFYDTFYINNYGTDGRGFKMRLLDNRAYVSTAYFVRMMGKGVEIGQKGNINFYTE